MSWLGSLGFDPTIIGPGGSGWIPPAYRTQEQTAIHEEFMEETPGFFDINRMQDIPDTAVLAALEWKVLGNKPLPRIHQLSGSCLPSHAPVRMADGTEKPIKDVVVGDYVISHTGRRQKVLGVQSKITTEKMRSIRVRGWSDRLLATDGHLVPVFASGQISWTRAEDVQHGDQILIGHLRRPTECQTINVLDYITGYDFAEIMEHKASKYKDRDVSETHNRTSALQNALESRGLAGKSLVCVAKGRYNNALPREIPVTAAFARWIGLYLAEGCTEEQRTTFTLSTLEQSLAEEIVQLTRGVFGLEAKIVRQKCRPGSLQVRIGGKTLAAFLKSYCPGKAATKRVPGHFFQADTSIRKALIGGWFDGDGYAKMHRKGMRITGVSGSPGMVRDFGQMAISCGIPSSTSYRKPRLRSKESASLGMWPEHARTVPSTKLEQIPVAVGYKECGSMTEFGMTKFVMSNDALDVPPEPVYDIEVENDHSFQAWGFVVHNCVGAGGWMSYAQAIIGDIAVRGDREDPKLPYPWATYGVGRQMSGSRRTGEGSTGSAQAKAINEWGMLPLDYPGLPQPTDEGGWLRWTSGIEISWSHPSGWPIDKSKLDSDAGKYRIMSVASLSKIQELKSALAQGYSVTIASNFGTRDERENNGFVVGTWSTSWSHQMTVGGYALHPSLGGLILIQNQWGANAHPKDPFMAKYNVNGCFWVTEATFQRVMNDGECFAHSNTLGFPVRKIDWNFMGIV